LEASASLEARRAS